MHVCFYRIPRVNSSGQLIAFDSNIKSDGIFHSLHTPQCGELHSCQYTRSAKHKDYAVEYLHSTGSKKCGYITHFKVDAQRRVSATIRPLTLHKESPFENVLYIKKYRMR